LTVALAGGDTCLYECLGVNEFCCEMLECIHRTWMNNIFHVLVGFTIDTDWARLDGEHRLIIFIPIPLKHLRPRRLPETCPPSSSLSSVPSNIIASLSWIPHGTSTKTGSTSQS
jgi:hypothetical protein